MTKSQMTQLTKFFEDLIRKMGLSKDEAQRLIKDFNLVKPGIENVLQKYRIADNRFELLKTFEIIVPKNYNHDTRLDTFATNNYKNFASFSPQISDANFSNVKTKLKPGQVMIVKLFSITEGFITPEDCRNFLRKQNAVLTGPQGTSLVFELKREEMPERKWCVSFQEKSTDENQMLTFMKVSINADIFFFKSVEISLRSDNCLLGFFYK